MYSDYHYTKKTEKYKAKLFVILLLAALTLLVIIISSFFSAKLLKNGTSYMPEYTYFALELNKFSDKNSANISASGIRAKGGAGYIISDRGYRVIAGLYLEEIKCKDVISSLKQSGYNGSIYVIKTKKIVIPKFERTEDGEKVVAAIEIFDSTLRALYGMFLRLDLGLMSSEDCKQQLNAERRKAESAAAKLNEVEISGKMDIIHLKAELNLLVNDLLRATNFDYNTPLSVEIKYLMVKIALNFRAFSLQAG